MGELSRAYGRLLAELVGIFFNGGGLGMENPVLDLDFFFLSPSLSSDWAFLSVVLDFRLGLSLFFMGVFRILWIFFFGGREEVKSRIGGRSSREGSSMFAGSRAEVRDRVGFPGVWFFFFGS